MSAAAVSATTCTTSSRSTADELDSMAVQAGDTTPRSQQVAVDAEFGPADTVVAVDARAVHWEEDVDGDVDTAALLSPELAAGEREQWREAMMSDEAHGEWSSVRQHGVVLSAMSTEVMDETVGRLRELLAALTPVASHRSVSVEKAMVARRAVEELVAAAQLLKKNMDLPQQEAVAEDGTSAAQMAAGQQPSRDGPLQHVQDVEERLRELDGREAVGEQVIDDQQDAAMRAGRSIGAESAKGKASAAVRGDRARKMDSSAVAADARCIGDGLGVQGAKKAGAGSTVRYMAALGSDEEQESASVASMRADKLQADEQHHYEDAAAVRASTGRSSSSVMRAGAGSAGVTGGGAQGANTQGMGVREVAHHGVLSAQHSGAAQSSGGAASGRVARGAVPHAQGSGIGNDASQRLGLAQAHGPPTGRQVATSWAGVVRGGAVGGNQRTDPTFLALPPGVTAQQRAALTPRHQEWRDHLLERVCSMWVHADVQVEFQRERTGWVRPSSAKLPREVFARPLQRDDDPLDWMVRALKRLRTHWGRVRWACQWFIDNWCDAVDPALMATLRAATQQACGRNALVPVEKPSVLDIALWLDVNMRASRMQGRDASSLVQQALAQWQCGSREYGLLGALSVQQYVMKFNELSAKIQQAVGFNDQLWTAQRQQMLFARGLPDPLKSTVMLQMGDTLGVMGIVTRLGRWLQVGGNTMDTKWKFSRATGGSALVAAPPDAAVVAAAVSTRAAAAAPSRSAERRRRATDPRWTRWVANFPEIPLPELKRMRRRGALGAGCCWQCGQRGGSDHRYSSCTEAPIPCAWCTQHGKGVTTSWRHPESMCARKWLANRSARESAPRRAAAVAPDASPQAAVPRPTGEASLRMEVAALRRELQRLAGAVASSVAGQRVGTQMQRQPTCDALVTMSARGGGTGPSAVHMQHAGAADAVGRANKTQETGASAMTDAEPSGSRQDPLQDICNERLERSMDDSEAVVHQQPGAQRVLPLDACVFAARPASGLIGKSLRDQQKHVGQTAGGCTHAVVNFVCADGTLGPAMCMLLDSGAYVSMIHPRALDALRAAGLEVEMRPGKARIVGINGKPQQASGWAMIRCAVTEHGASARLPFAVVPGLDIYYDLLLGMTDMWWLGQQMDHARAVVRFTAVREPDGSPMTVPLDLLVESEHGVVAVSADTVWDLVLVKPAVVGPKAVQRVQVVLRSPGLRHEQLCGAISSLPGCSVEVVDVYMQEFAGQTMVTLLSPDAGVHELPAGTAVARFDPEARVVGLPDQVVAALRGAVERDGTEWDVGSGTGAQQAATATSSTVGFHSRQ